MFLRLCIVLCCAATQLLGQDMPSHGIVSTYAIRCDTGEVLVDKESARSLIPASCMKIVTTGAALHMLGADTRFETYLEYDGSINPATHTLQGNLYIRGGGDPCLGYDRASGALPWEKQLATWAEAVLALGIRCIDGNVIGDATCWESALAAPGWTWEDLGNYYGAGACALSFHENCYSLVFRPGSTVGEKAAIVRTDPPLIGVTLHNEVLTGPEGSGDRACIYGSEYSPVQYVRGTVPAGVDEFVIKGAIPDPAAWCADLLAQELLRRGISLKRQDLPPAKRVTFHTTYSPTVAEIVSWTNKKSINLYAEHLLKKMGEVVFQEGFTAAGIKAVTQYWHSQGIDLTGFHMADGSGLSRTNLVTTKQLVHILLHMKKSPFFPLFFASLPEQEGSIRAKSGSMSRIKGYAGYKDNVVFAILMNHLSPCPPLLPPASF